MPYALPTAPARPVLDALLGSLDLHAPQPGLDVSACDREPIHVPGAIQPFGLLLIADAATLQVVAGAGALEELFGADWPGSDLGDLLDQDVAALIGGLSQDANIAALPLKLESTCHAVTLHLAAGRILAELEPDNPASRGASAVLGWIDTVSSGFERASDLASLCQRAAVAFRSLTGFDRVMIYHFLDDDAGRVLAEDRDERLGTFLHHHFPASDIPRQARALYVRNRTRAIPEIDYTPAPIRPAEFAGTDLSAVAIRSVSPIHLQYLRNMGVGASASISIVKDGVLWGLVACHHYTPRRLPPDIRATAAALAGEVARQIRMREEADSYRERLRLRTAEDGIVGALAKGDSLPPVIAQIAPELRAMMRADGLVLVRGDTVEPDGAVPPPDRCVAIARWARGRGALEPFATRELSGVFPEAADYRDLASGLLAMPLVEDDAVLLWFRAEQVQEVEWAGNPHKAVDVAPGEALTPRSSFESWTEVVRGCSRAWTLEEVEAAHRLRRTFHETHQARALRHLARDLQRTVADKDALIAQKDVLMREVNHRVQNSLQLVSAFLSLQAKAANDETVSEHLSTAQRRLSAVALVHRRLYRDEQVETVDLARYLEELAEDVKASLGHEWAERMRLRLAPVLMPTDRAVNIGLILTELVINATKYAYDGGAGPIAIALEQHGSRLRLIVADEGRGKTGTREGFGSRMMTAMVDRLGGELALTDNAPGLRAVLTCPIEDRPR